MKRTARTWATLALAAVVGLTSEMSYAETIVGVFQTEDRKQDYQVSFCGQDDKFLCVKLLALRAKKRNPKADALIGSYIVNKAKPTGKNTWQGQITLDGKTGDSTLRLDPGVSLYVKACTAIVVCGDITLPIAVASK